MKTLLTALALALALGSLEPKPAHAGAIVVIDGIIDSVLTDRVVVRTDIMKYTIPFSAMNPEQRNRVTRPEQRITVTIAIELIARMEFIQGSLAP